MKKTDKKIFPYSFILISVCILFLMAIYLAACSELEEKSKTSDAADSVTQAAYEAKITYYESQLQNLSNQLTEMDQALYLIRAEYEERTKELEQEITSLRQAQDKTVTPELQPTDSDPVGGAAEIPNPGDSHQATQDSPFDESVNITVGGEEDENESTDTEEKSATFTYREEGDGLILLKYIGNEKVVNVPAAINGKRVIGLADSVFAQTAVSSVCLPATVKKLGWFTFYQCASLTSVTIPASVENIGYASFDGCHKTLCLFVEKGSYAEKFAISFAIAYKTVN